MYTINQLSDISGYPYSTIRHRIETENIQPVKLDGFNHYTKKQSEIILSRKIIEPISEILFADFVAQNPNLSPSERCEVLCIDEDFTVKDSDYTYESKLNHKKLSEL